MPRIFDREKLVPDCGACDALCCVAPALDLPHYPKPAQTPCRNLDATRMKCQIFATLEEEGFTFCRQFDCYGAGGAVTELFRRLGKNWESDPEIATTQFHVFDIVYFELVLYLHPGRAISLDVPDARLRELAPFTEAALDILAGTTDPFARALSG